MNKNKSLYEFRRYLDIKGWRYMRKVNIFDAWIYMEHRDKCYMDKLERERRGREDRIWDKPENDDLYQKAIRLVFALWIITIFCRILVYCDIL
jgi:hypothetical protein